MLKVFRPCPALKPYIVDLTDFQFILPHGSADCLVKSAAPDVTTGLIFSYGDPFHVLNETVDMKGRSVLTGFRSSTIDVFSRGAFSGIGITLTPWAVRCLIRDSASLFSNKVIQCEDLFSRSDIDRLETRLSELPTPRARVTAVEEFLLRYFHEPTHYNLVSAIVIDMAQLLGGVTVRALAEKFDISDRTLERHFLNYFGVSPKHFSRVMRIKNVLRFKTPGRSWTEVAHMVGYFDQSHLLRDFRQLVGSTPQSYISQVSTPVGALYDMSAEEDLFRAYTR